MIDIEAIDTVAKAYALHNKLHGDYVDPRWGHRRKVDIQTEHETMVRAILRLGGRHLAKGDVLDDTLPQELKEAFKLHYLSNNLVLTNDTARSVIQILRTGTFYHPLYGRFTVSKKVLEIMVANFEQHHPKPPTELVVDWEHTSAIEPPQKSPAAGWIKGLVIKDDGLFADVEWTEEAASEIRAGEYRFISPEFNLNYRDKETGEPIGATLLAVALTNRPFIEGMLPVVLSDRLADKIIREVDMTQTQVNGATNLLVVGTSEDNFITMGDEVVGLVEWTVAYINDLPDNAFAYIKPGGEKDEEGKTVPRTLRYLPYKDKDGEVDLPHLRNALARLPQTELTPEERAKARRVLIEAAREAGVGEYSDLPGVTADEWAGVALSVMVGRVREVLGITEDADLVEKVRLVAVSAKDLAIKLASAEQRAVEANTKLEGVEIDKLVGDAIRQGKILPKQEAWARDMCLHDRQRFVSYLETAERIAPDLRILGRGGEDDVHFTADELVIAERMGVTREQLRSAKAQRK